MENQALEWENKEHEENAGNMAWILNKGLAVGKKMLITGVVISSAPVILPPLMVISTLGLVCAVPYGLFLASYACTQTLITKLLPSPKAFPVTYEDLRAKDDYDKYGGDVDMANEEEELRRRVEMRLEQDEKENYEEGVDDKDETVEKNGYAEDLLAKEDEKPTEETRGVTIVIEEEEENGSNVKEKVSFDATDVAVELCQSDDAKANEETVEKNGYAEDVLSKEDDKPTEETRGVTIVIEEEEENGSNVKEKVSFDATDVAVELCRSDDGKTNEELVKETTGLLERIRDEGMSDEVEGKDEQSAKSGHEGAERGLKGTDKKVPQTVTQSRNGKGNGGSAKETKANHVEENRKVENVDAREIADESGIHLFDGKNKARSDYATPEGNKKKGLKDTDFLEVTVPSKVNAPGSGGNASEEVVYSEEKVWKQIDAMRAIVGYTTARHTTCIEELKALYVFTGVEPPASFKDPSDLVEINDKLRFLMSVVGVK